MDFENDLGIDSQTRSIATGVISGVRKRVSDELTVGENPGKRKVCAANAAILASGNSALNNLKSGQSKSSDNGKSPNMADSVVADKEKRDRRTFKYSNKDKGPYIVHVYSDANESGKSPHPLAMARVISSVVGNDTLEIKSIGRGKILTSLKSFSSANALISSISLSNNKYRAFIPSYLVSRTGVIRNIPTEYSESFLKDNLKSTSQISEIRRINRKTTINGKVEFVPTSAV